MKEEDPPYLPGLHAEAHQHGDVAALLHDQHGQRDQNVERCDAHNQRDHNEGDGLLQLQGTEEFAVLVHPVGRLKPGAGARLDGTPDAVRVVQVVHLEADDGDQVWLREQALRICEPHKAVGRVVLEEARMKDAGKLKTLVLRHQAERR